ncbi:RNase adapter RapZ [bacterium]|nr:RNase adapter RapZ [bacterium]MCI0605671.1 RNase adapter RapZ [bacterium]
MVEPQNPTQFLIITGLSGSGKSGVNKCFEDLGYFCVDNLPAKLIPTFVQLCTKPGAEIRRVAMTMDIRERDFIYDFPEIYHSMKAEGYDFSILFLEASDEVLVRRFSETRRPHPLAFDRPVLQGIVEERERLRALRDMADIIIDTSNLTIHELREHINKIYSPSAEAKPLIISLISFGYKYGIPFNSDILFDVRFLPNPFFVQDLKNKTGLDARVQEYVFENEEWMQFREKLADLLFFLLPKFVREGKSYLTLSIGCTGGKHRSVAIADYLEKLLKEKGHMVRCKHRDMNKE